MYSSGGQVALQSHQWLAGHTDDRPSFDAYISRGFSERRFQVFALSRGLLCLEKPKVSAGGNGDSARKAMVVGSLLGGFMGAVIAGGIANSLSSGPAADAARYDLCSEEELLEFAKKSRHNIVAPYDDISFISLDPPGFWAKLLGNQRVAGSVTFDDRKLGKVKMELRDPLAMSVAVEALPRRLAYRVQVNVKYDERLRTFVAKA